MLEVLIGIELASLGILVYVATKLAIINDVSHDIRNILKQQEK